jgi:hypothetical protein
VVGLSDLGLYQRTLLIFNAEWENVQVGQWTNAASRRDPQVTVAVDLTQGLWILRGKNWQLGRARFLGAASGTAKKSWSDIVLKTPKGDVIIQNYYMNDAPKREGPAFRGDHPQAKGVFAQRTYWWRYDDPSIMDPFDRMAEMLDRAVRSPKLRQQIASQFQGLISPEVLLPMAGLFFAMFGTEFVGGAAAALALARLMGVHQLFCDYYFYEPRAQALHRIVMGAAVPKDLEYGADLLVEILCQVLTDIGMALGMASLTKIASKLFSLLMTMTPESIRLLLKDNMHAAAAYIRGKGYARRDLLKDPHGTPMEQAAIDMYKRTSEQKREILVVREPDAQRAAWIDAPNVHHNSKPTWLKARSPDGYHGLVCLPKADVPGPLKPAGTYQTGQIRGASAALDAEHLPARLPMYEMPTDGRPMGKPGEGIDYGYSGKGNVELKGHKLVDLGDRYIVVDALGRPYVSDLDLATRQRPGLSQAGAHLPAGKPGHIEDSWALEYEMNREYTRSGGHPTHNPNNHGGAGATVVYTRENLANHKVPGKDFWTPIKDGKWKQERLVIFVPEWNGKKIESKMYVLESWEAFREFAKENGLEFPFGK